MGLSDFDLGLLSTIAYSDDVDNWEEGTDLQAYIQGQLGSGDELSNNPWLNEKTGEDTWMTTDEWHAVLETAASNETLSGFEVYKVTPNETDKSNMICLKNPSTGEVVFVFEGTCTLEGWGENGGLLALGDTQSQNDAARWAQDIMDELGDDYAYMACGHSKGGSQAATLAREDSRIRSAYSFDGPGDDVEHSKDGRIHYRNNENDFVSPLLFSLSQETLLGSRSDDPKHATGVMGAHSPSNLFTFRYDENGHLVCEGLGSDVTDEGGAWYRELLRQVSQHAGRKGGISRAVLASEFSALLIVLMDDNKNGFVKAIEVLAVLKTNGPITTYFFATIAGGLTLYGLAKVRSLLTSVFGEGAALFVDALLFIAEAFDYVGAQLENAIAFAASMLVSYLNEAWAAVKSWVRDVVDRCKKMLDDIGDFFDSIGKAISDFFSGGPKVYDFSSSRLDDMRRAYERAHATESLSPESWTICYADEPFSRRLSLEPSQKLINSSINNEWSISKAAISKADAAFRQAYAEDRRFSEELSNMSSGVRSAIAMLA